MSFDWKSLVASVAPTLATALGGPLAGTAVSALSQALLGKADGTEAEVGAALVAADPATLLKLKEADNAFAVEMKKLDIDFERVNAADRDSARQREIQTGDVWTPRILAGAVILGWFGVQWFLLTHIIPQEMREIVLRGLGTLDLAIGLILGYYFGSSSGSQAKTDALASIKGRD